MKIGVIADIHGDFEALRLALELLEQYRVDQVLCAGDLIGKGPNGDAVIKLLISESIPCIAGNHDRTELDLGAYTGEALTFLKALPNTLNFLWEGKHVFLAHGTLWSDFIAQT